MLHYIIVTHYKQLWTLISLTHAPINLQWSPSDTIQLTLVICSVTFAIRHSHYLDLLEIQKTLNH